MSIGDIYDKFYLRNQHHQNSGWTLLGSKRAYFWSLTKLPEKLEFFSFFIIKEKMIKMFSGFMPQEELLCKNKVGLTFDPEFSFG